MSARSKRMFISLRKRHVEDHLQRNCNIQEAEPTMMHTFSTPPATAERADKRPNPADAEGLGMAKHYLDPTINAYLKNT